MLIGQIPVSEFSLGFGIFAYCVGIGLLCIIVTALTKSREADDKVTMARVRKGLLTWAMTLNISFLAIGLPLYVLYRLTA